MKEDLINYDRTWRTMICINPDHETLKFNTNKVGNIKCPICDHLMIKEVKPVFDMDEHINATLDE